EHCVADCLGVARLDGRWEGRPSFSQARHRLSSARARCRRILGRGAFHRDRLSARLLSALPRLRETLPAMGTRPLSQFEGVQHHVGSGRDVSRQEQGLGFVLAAAGLRAEARVAARVPQVRAVAGGGDGRRLEQVIQQEIAQGAEAIISFGIAAGLVAGKLPGTCVVGREIMYGDLRYPTDAAWAARISAAISGGELTTIAGVDRPLERPGEKRALYAKTRAVAADMESHIAARIAAEHGLPFATLRVIAD